MKKAILLLLLITTLCGAQEKTDEAMITDTLLDYAEGAFLADGARARSSFVPELHKMMVIQIAEGVEVLNRTTPTLMFEGANAELIKMPEDQWGIKTEVLKINKNTASALLETSRYIDFSQLARINGEWKIVNVVWSSPQVRQRPITDEDKEQIKKTAYNYLDGLYSSDSVRLGSALSTSLQHVMVSKLRNNEREYIHATDYLMMMQDCAAKMSAMPEENRNIEITLLKAIGNMAVVYVDSSLIQSMVHLCHLNGEWKIVNVLWTINR